MTIFYTCTLLLISNSFMAFAWYGHLKFKDSPLIWAIAISWGIAFFEYMFQVPANRIGHSYFSVMQLRTLQEIISLFVFVIFSTMYFGEALKLNHVVGLLVIVVGTMIIFLGSSEPVTLL